MSENKKDGVFTGETRTITHPAPAAIKPPKPRPEQVAQTKFIRGQPTGNIS